MALKAVLDRCCRECGEEYEVTLHSDGSVHTLTHVCQAWKTQEDPRPPDPPTRTFGIGAAWLAADEPPVAGPTGKERIW